MFLFIFSFQPSPILGNSGRQATTDDTPLIVGLVVGLTGFLILLAILVALIYYFKFKKGSGKKKPKVSRARANGRSAGDALSSRVQARNPRAVRLAPLAPVAAASALPTVPVKTVLPPTKSSLLNESNLTSQVSPKGIPVRLDPIRYEMILYSFIGRCFSVDHRLISIQSIHLIPML